MAEKYLIKGFVPNSLVDWDGKVSSVIFLPGCNFKCKYCHNKQLVERYDKLENVSFKEIREYLKKNQDFIDGVVITGGEPCLYSWINDLCKEIKALGFEIKLETNGSFPEKLQELLKSKLIDFVAMDIKTSFDNYEKITQSPIDINKIKQSISILKDFGNYEFRITMFPEISKENLIDISSYLKENQANKALFLQQFRAENCLDEQANSVKPYQAEELQALLELIKPDFAKSGLRNL
ncbi:MAG: anaerobic ribonucleoside-triphosphate reductase activating protein [Candidatus Pacearchaeota archaeon]|nr:anaerobic ribonucleoside-triphosphate reductase activating protein [Candidatus Pacearchaeota archaeon]